MLKDAATDHYYTMILADVNVKTGKVVFAQAGHPSPVIQRADGSVEFAVSSGLPIGLIEGAEYDSFELQLDPGGRLLLYSDGVTECPDPNDVQLDDEGLAAFLRSAAAIKGPELLDELVAKLEQYSGLSEFPDDLSAVLLELKAKACDDE